jgi:hypothetical protein
MNPQENTHMSELQAIILAGGPLDRREMDTVPGRNRITYGMAPNRDIYRRTTETDAGRVVFTWAGNEAAKPDEITPEA